MDFPSILNSKSVSLDEFAHTLIACLKDKGETRQITYNTANFSIKIGDDHFFLESRYHRYIAATEKEKTLDLIAQELKPPKGPCAFKEAKPLLMPMIHSQMRRNIRTLSLKTMQVDTGHEISNPFAGDLAEGFIIDFPQAMQPVIHENLEQWQTNATTVKEVALRNLRKESKPDFERIDSNIYRGAWADGFDASRLLLPDLFSSIASSNNLIAIASNNDCLWITDNTNPENLVTLIEYASYAMFNEGNALTPDILRLNNFKWQSFVPDNAHPAYEPHQTMLKKWILDIYGEQQTALRQIYQDEDNDPFISTYSLGKRKNTIESYTAWTQGINVPLWLPKTDTIVFVPKNEDPFPVPWSIVENVLGKLPRIDDLKKPVRYEVTKFPSPDQIKAIQCLVSK